MSSKKPASKSIQTANKPAVEGVGSLNELKEKDQTKSRATTFSSYIFKVLNQVYPDISNDTIKTKIMKTFISDIFEKFVEIGVPINTNEKHKLKSEDLRTAITSVLTPKF